MTTANFDPIAYKANQRTQWNAQSAAWGAWLVDFERGAGAVTARLLELAGVRSGQAVLDVATGQGDVALSAARVVGPTGRVVGVDIAAAMLDVARQRAAGLHNVEFVEADMEALGQPPASFDVVLSRFGLMFAVDHVATFQALARTLVSGGVLAAAVWGPASSNGLFSGARALSQLLELPPPDPRTPGPFSMSEPQRLTKELTAAGFVDVSVTEHVLTFEFESVKHYLRFNKAFLPPQMHQMIQQRFGSADAPAAWDVVASAVQPSVEVSGALRLPSTALCLRAVASGP